MLITRIKTLWPEDDGFVLERDVNDEYIFLHLLTDMYAYFDGNLTKLPSGSCFSYAPGDHQYIKAANGGLLHNWMHLTCNFGKIAEKYGFQNGKIYRPADDSFVTELMRSAELEHMNGGTFADDICEMKVTELVARLVRADKNSGGVIAPSVNAAFAEARAHIHMEYRKPWEIEQMAELVHLSPSRFFAIYRSVFGVSPKSDLVNIRMEHAKRFLAAGCYSVKEVAEMTGYTNVYHFIRSFRTHTGKTPGKYREEH